MDEEPTIDELLEFRSLVQAKDKIAVAVHDEYQQTKNQRLFHKGIKETLRNIKRQSSHQQSSAAAKKDSDSSKSSKTQTCFAFRETGVCNNDKCRFSHDPALRAAMSTSTSTATTNPTNAPAQRENSIGKIPTIIFKITF